MLTGDSVDLPDTDVKIYLYVLFWILLIFSAMVVMYKFDLATVVHSFVISDDGIDDDGSSLTTHAKDTLAARSARQVCGRSNRHMLY